MADWDLVLRAGTVVRTDGVERADLGIVDGVVAGLQRDLHGQARTEIDCSGLHVFPGVLDSHVALQ
jgi:allantoinase